MTSAWGSARLDYLAASRKTFRQHHAIRFRRKAQSAIAHAPIVFAPLIDAAVALAGPFGHHSSAVFS